MCCTTFDYAFLDVQATHLNGHSIWQRRLNIRLVALTAGVQNQGQRGHQALLSHPERLMPLRLLPSAGLPAEYMRRGLGHIVDIVLVECRRTGVVTRLPGCRPLGAHCMTRDRHRIDADASCLFIAPVAWGWTAITARQPEQGCTGRDMRRDRHPDLVYQSALCTRSADRIVGSSPCGVSITCLLCASLPVLDL